VICSCLATATFDFVRILHWCYDRISTTLGRLVRFLPVLSSSFTPPHLYFRADNKTDLAQLIPETKGLSLEQVDILYRNSTILKSNAYRKEILAHDMHDDEHVKYERSKPRTEHVEGQGKGGGSHESDEHIDGQSA
jgi:hypothetical protein